MRLKLVFPCICVLLLLAVMFTSQGERPASVTDGTIVYFKRQQPLFAASAVALKHSIDALKAGDTATVSAARASLYLCRIRYKAIAFFLEYFFTSEAYVFNAPAKYEIEEPYIEYEEPVGLQQIEALLYDSAVYQRKGELAAQATVLVQTAQDLPSLLYQFSATDQQVLESVRQELIRIMTLYITGYDAPLLKSGIAEARCSMQAIDTVLMSYTGFEKKDSITYYLRQGIQQLTAHPDFDSFDRLSFLVSSALPLQRLVLNSRHDLFHPAVISKDKFPHSSIAGDTALGRRLFFEKALSGNNTRSCASCHQPDRYFSDGLPHNSAINNKEALPRHTPGLLYACYQYSQFWDGRAVSLEDQVLKVLHSPQEMDACDDTLLQRLQRMPAYQDITLPQVQASLAAYLRTLTPFNAPFDRYMAGNKQAMTAEQRTGANIFMGKGQCATCHFAPLFNGLIPPLYNRTEFEVLGTPSNDDLLHPQADHDSGRLAFFPIDFYMGAFKTPTVRNAAPTAPYMHNGAFRTMEQVIDFYDKGGGNGIGLSVPNQTLSAAPLQLSPEEKKALIAFMDALTDGK
ncbi:cytochrome-c peroxidase [Chitinophaga pinensis]|uniref:Cytochrome-c peroxidase n=1 Tax=Chitinophaga pinensis (strain ATCC 43595 / DSM 2588 / LMG 13176 / NBRC 15968 / NCIMB 11800 / UQM 2034) TaxID=485918 RepID=A0A979G9D2_CHIPD|nr:cytochrome c peroxidase [Chitinophaga pinensis]ACU63225.1 Cytochrome-c peroxidase [Chitinophaga pinensis DSM 2588]